jgi:hypothetical protein
MSYTEEKRREENRREQKRTEENRREQKRTDRVWECAQCAHRAVQPQIYAILHNWPDSPQAMRKPPDWHPAAHSRNSGPASFANRVGEQALVSGGH